MAEFKESLRHRKHSSGRMKELESGIYELNRSKYENLKEKAVLAQSNNASDQVRNYFILKKKNGTMDLVSHELSLYAGSKPSYMLYRNVNSQQIQAISGIPLSRYVKYLP